MRSFANGRNCSRSVRHSRTKKSVQIFACGCVLFLVAVAAGCLQRDINTFYGQRKGAAGADSVNGTAVLAGMFEDAGFKVQSWRRLSPKLQKSQVLVWFPTRFTPPTLEQRLWLEDWLQQDSGRTLIYVGRDYEAGIKYWKTMLPKAPAAQAVEISRRLANLQSAHDNSRIDMPADEYARWFQMQRDGRKTSIKKLEGDWATGIDASKTEIELEGRLAIPSQKNLDKALRPATTATTTPATTSPTAVPPPTPPVKKGPFSFPKTPTFDEPNSLLEYEALLKSGDDFLVTRVTDEDWDGSQILVIANGSFLLNLPLVNHEHRKLAGKLIEECTMPEQPSRPIVTFLENGLADLDVLDSEPEENQPTGLELFTVWPINVVVIHLIALGILFCFARYPIFGRPARIPNDSVSDFSSHIQAVGELLERGNDEQFARERLAYYQQLMKREPPAGGSR